eukprot:1161796-Pelagomonas_calceolata.AAC.7
MPHAVAVFKKCHANVVHIVHIYVHRMAVLSAVWINPERGSAYCACRHFNQRCRVSSAVCARGCACTCALKRGASRPSKSKCRLVVPFSKTFPALFPYMHCHYKASYSYLLRVQMLWMVCFFTWVCHHSGLALTCRACGAGVTGSQAFAAWDAGFDVWLGNSRCNAPRLHQAEVTCGQINSNNAMNGGVFQLF